MVMDDNCEDTNIFLRAESLYKLSVKSKCNERTQEKTMSSVCVKHK